jgi:hypothetical protein
MELIKSSLDFVLEKFLFFTNFSMYAVGTFIIAGLFSYPLLRVFFLKNMIEFRRNFGFFRFRFLTTNERVSEAIIHESSKTEELMERIKNSREVLYAEGMKIGLKLRLEKIMSMERCARVSGFVINNKAEMAVTKARNALALKQ